jgi:hypothetical protein
MGSSIWRGHGAARGRTEQFRLRDQCECVCVWVRVGDPNGSMAASRPEGSPPTRRAVPHPLVYIEYPRVPHQPCRLGRCRPACVRDAPSPQWLGTGVPARESPAHRPESRCGGIYNGALAR